METQIRKGMGNNSYKQVLTTSIRALKHRNEQEAVNEAGGQRKPIILHSREFELHSVQIEMLVRQRYAERKSKRSYVRVQGQLHQKYCGHVEESESDGKFQINSGTRVQALREAK
jgi:hypothetical protein